MRWLMLAAALNLLLCGPGAGERMIISEVMSNPKGNESGVGSPGDRNEYVEVYNADSISIDVQGWIVWDGDVFDVIKAWSDTNLVDPDVVTDTTVIEPGCYAVILDPEYTDTGDSNYCQPYDFPPGTIILTVSNTTIGNGLSADDPLSIGTPDTTFVDTYGTPDDTTDSIPFDAGDGKSIERIDLLGPDREDNWAPCKDSMGTPGGKNSVTGVLEGGTIQRKGVGLRLRAHPNPFLGHVTIDVSGQLKGTAPITICDVAGRRVRLLERGRSGSGRYQIVWDGLDDCGLAVPPGAYFCVLIVGEERGELSLVRVR